MKLEDQQKATPDIVKKMELLIESCKFSLVGWENMIDPDTKSAIEFDPDKMNDLLTMEEAFELVKKIMAQIPSNEEKKTSGLPSESDTEQSAQDATETPTNAETGQANQTP
jgi:hypothetical protein